ncbi:MAG: carboxypeptidase regulatory-like domain-containing protein [Candidatus Cloacimonetes bacterium]|nr:carboxypeptidase regulatory-like domain-containing protein [Candidatus Cloacimonadota bacterium]
MKNKSALFIIHYSLYILIIITLLSCTTSPQTGSLSGNIQLENETDHSGITVALYELAELDPDIVAINEEYPHIGVIINQTTEFDHRFGNLVKYTETDANGNFKIKNIPTGRYNVVAMKDNFGFKYIYEISVSDGENNLSNLMKHNPFNTPTAELNKRNFEIKNLKCKKKNDEKKSNYDNFTSSILSTLHSSTATEDGHFTFDSNGYKRNTANIILYPATYIHEDITVPTTFESFHHYIIENDIYVSGSLTIKPGAVIRIEKDKKLTISGDLTAIGEEEDMIWFTSNDSILHSTFYILHSPPKEDVTPSPYNRVELIGSLNKQVAFCKFTQAGTGLLNRVNGFSISDCIFRSSFCGFKAESVDFAFCSNLLCENITNASFAGIYFESKIDGYIKNSIFNNCENGIKIKVESNPEVMNNFINSCGSGIDISWYSSPNIQNNEILLSNHGIETMWSHPIIINNIIHTEIGIYCYYGYDEINYNNIECDIYAIELGYYYEANGIDISAQNNYFYTIKDEEIQQLIYDKNDVDEAQQEHIGFVYYNPFLTQEYPFAGIQGE